MNMNQKPVFASHLPNPLYGTLFAHEVSITESVKTPTMTFGTVIPARAHIMVPEMAQDWQRGQWFTPPTEMLNVSIKAAREYKKTYIKQYSRQYPWVLKRSTVTGLPRYIRGGLTNSPVSSNDALRISRDWLGTVSNIVSPSTSKDVYEHFPETKIKPKIITSYSYRNKKSFHTQFQQYHQQNIPIYGAKIVVHTVESDKRVSSSSSYLYIQPDRKFKGVISKEDAIKTALKVINHYEPNRGKLSQLLSIARQSWVPRGFEARWASTLLKDQREWVPSIHQYATEDLFILPFAGEQYLAYEIHLTQKETGDIYRVFVSAEEKDKALGRPMNLSYFSNYFVSSDDALSTFNELESNNGEIKISSYMPDLQRNPCAHFMRITLLSPRDEDKLINWKTNSEEITSASFVINNIAINALKMYEYLLPKKTREEEANRRKLKLVLKLNSTSNSPKISFNYANREIRLTHNPDWNSNQGVYSAGVARNSSINIYNPVLDPEVIFHEVAHALMWRLIPDPFEYIVDEAPFARSLVEGYAMYFARSFGSIQSKKNDSFSRWAKAAYRDEWGTRWGFSRGLERSGEDLLPAPNRYPHVSRRMDELQQYDIGMIWARSLWDIRLMVGQEIADKLALQAFHYSLGWITSFESTSEGLLDQALTDPAITANGTFEILFANRGIMAGQGVQAVATLGEKVLVGGDAGLLLRENDQAGWQEVLTIDGNNKIENIVALEVFEDSFYVATETRVYKLLEAGLELLGGDQWNRIVQVENQVGDGYEEHSVDYSPQPLSLAVANGQLYVGTGVGLWLFDESTSSWAQLRDSGNKLKEVLAIDVALQSDWVFVACSDALRIFNGGVWEKRQVEGEQSIHCVVSNESKIFTGADGVGVSQFDFNTQKLVSISDSDFFEDISVLCLSEYRENELLAGTTRGLYLGKKNINTWTWQPVNFFSNRDGSALIITSLAVSGTCIYAGTAMQGLWCGEYTLADELITWTRIHREIKKAISMDSVPVLDSASHTFTTKKTEINLFPFYLESSKTIAATAAEHSRLDLWRLETNISLEADSANGDINIQLQPGFYTLAVTHLGLIAALEVLQIEMRMS